MNIKDEHSIRSTDDVQKTVPIGGKVNPDLSRDRAKDARVRDDNPDAITGEPGSHPVGTGVGAGAAGAAGAAVGTILGGPIGGAIGAAVGAIAGGYAGKGVAEAVDPTAEDAFWRNEYSRRPYVVNGSPYDLYAPAYRYGWEAHRQHKARPFDEVEPELARDWANRRGNSSLDWDDARPATQDAYRRVEELRTHGRI